MTTPAYPSVTDELLHELEQRSIYCSRNRIPVDVNPFDVAVMLAELRTLRAENAALAKDAGRYRWLRDKCERYDGGLVVAKVTEYSIESWSGDDPDRAIDTAMQEKAK
jgi:hypothetical protein